jgi:hypothetical protein
MANEYTKKSSTSLVIREMQIKTTLRVHLTTVRMAIIKKTNNNCCQGWGQTHTRTHTEEYYLVLFQKNETTLFAGKWMEMEIMMLREISQDVKDTYHMFSLICRM